MPKSKRSQVVTLSKTKQKGREHKQALVQQLRDSLEEYSHVFIFSVENMRNTFLKEMRDELKGNCRFYFGRNKVMQKALGTSEEDEYKCGLKEVGQRLEGSVGVLLTNSDPEEIKAYFSTYKQMDYARSGFVATDTVVIPAGPVVRNDEKFPNNMESQLRSLGMPTKLVQGVVTLDRDFEICRKNQPLTPDQAQLLKLFYVQMADFHVDLLCHWHNGQFKEL
jgi:mRNA turnover protein 4